MFNVPVFKLARSELLVTALVKYRHYKSNEVNKKKISSILAVPLTANELRRLNLNIACVGLGREREV